MIIAADISYYQKKVDSTYPREWLIVRACDGAFLDPNASFNADWCRGAVAQGRMLGWTAYVVYRPGMNGSILQNLVSLGGPWDRFMVDIESWSGQIKGDHSADINSLIEDLAAIAGGQERVWRYGNQGDLASIHPHPLANQLTHVASYTATRPNLPNLIGWQYTDGSQNHTTNPSTSAPFGACDHNELYVDELPPSGGGQPIGAEMELTDLIPVWGSSTASQTVSFALAKAAGATDALAAESTELTQIANAITALQQPEVDESQLAADLASSLQASLPASFVAALAAKLGASS